MCHGEIDTRILLAEVEARVAEVRATAGAGRTADDASGRLLARVKSWLAPVLRKVAHV